MEGGRRVRHENDIIVRGHRRDPDVGRRLRRGIRTLGRRRLAQHKRRQQPSLRDRIPDAHGLRRSRTGDDAVVGHLGHGEPHAEHGGLRGRLRLLREMVGDRRPFRACKKKHPHRRRRCAHARTGARLGRVLQRPRRLRGRQGLRAVPHGRPADGGRVQRQRPFSGVQIDGREQHRRSRPEHDAPHLRRERGREVPPDRDVQRTLRVPERHGRHEALAGPEREVLQPGTRDRRGRVPVRRHGDERQPRDRLRAGVDRPRRAPRHRRPAGLGDGRRRLPLHVRHGRSTTGGCTCRALCRTAPTRRRR